VGLDPRLEVDGAQPDVAAESKGRQLTAVDGSENGVIAEPRACSYVAGAQQALAFSSIVARSWLNPWAAVPSL
jgi:hypothetical protein